MVAKQTSWVGYSFITEPKKTIRVQKKILANEKKQYLNQEGKKAYANKNTKKA